MKKQEHKDVKKTKAELKKLIKKKYRSKDPHKELYSKEYHEVKYSKEHICPICGSRIDENGMCACGAGDS
jgi:rubrerythrin